MIRGEEFVGVAVIEVVSVGEFDVFRTFNDGRPKVFVALDDKEVGAVAKCVKSFALVWEEVASCFLGFSEERSEGFFE